MSMLAEPRSRQKWSHDPRNTNWSNDKTKFGYQMLTKMGWSEGNGLGLNLSGNVSHIKVNKRGSNAGVGLKKSHEDDWIGHQDDFNALLNSLNGNPASETATPVEKMKATRHRYTKFVKSKDLSNASNDDLACIFGQRGKSTAGGAAEEPADDLDGSETPEAVEEEQDSIKTVESTLSMNEYFAKKMAALKQKSVVANSPICTSNIAKVTVDEQKIEEVENNETGDCGKVKKKKRKKKEEEENLIPEEENCEPVKKKKKKKSSNDDSEIQVPSPCTELKDDSNELNGVNCDIVEKKKKKKKVKECEVESPIPSPLFEPPTDLVDSEIVTKKKKKKKKSKENDDVESPAPSPCPESDENDCVESKKKKKRKKEKSAACKGDENVEPCKEIDNNQENESLFIETKPEKKKKRKGNEDTEKDIEKQSDEQTDEGVKKKKKKKKNREEISSEESNQ